MKELKIVYTIKRYKDRIMAGMHHDLLKYYKEIDADVTTDFENHIITITVRDKKRIEQDLKDLRSLHGAGRKIISAFVKTEFFIDGKEAK